MSRLKTRTTARYFENDKYVTDGLNCWTKSGTDFECRVECPYNKVKDEQDCIKAVCADALSLIKELTEDNNRCAKRILETDKTIAELRKNADEIAKTLPMAKKEIQADTVRKMHSLCKERAVIMVNTQDEQAVVVDVEDIDQIVKEMLEGER